MKTALLLLAVFASTIGCSQITSEQAKAMSHHVAQAIGVPFDSSRASVSSYRDRTSGLTILTVIFGAQAYTLDSRFPYVRIYTDMSVEKAARGSSGGSQAYYSTPEQAWKRAENILNALEPGLSLSRGKADIPTAQSSAIFASFSFSQLANGQDTGGVGNHFSLQLDRRTGKVASLSLSKGWTYDPVNVRLTEQQAAAKAQGYVTAADPSLPIQVRGTSQQYALAVRGFGCQNRETLQAQRRIRYAYVVRFDNCVVFVDAETGASLGGKRLR